MREQPKKFSISLASITLYIANQFVVINLLLNLLFSTFSFASASTKQSLDDVKAKLCTLAEEVTISEELTSVFYDYALMTAKERISATDEFWNWLSENQEIQQGLLVGLHPDYNPDVVKHLEELRNTFGERVEQYPHLLLAFSFVFGAVEDDNVRSRWIKPWTSKNREVPSCCDSFSYYLENKETMLYPLDLLPWPLMVFVADNDVPLSERKWALNRYQEKTVAGLVELHNAPPYVKGTGTNTLPEIRQEGGVCFQQAYYAYSVMKSLGVPATEVGGPPIVIGGLFHIYEGWVVANNKQMAAKIGNSFGHTNGNCFSPYTRKPLKEYEFKMLVSAINHSYDRYLQSKIACAIFNMLDENTKQRATRLLGAAIRCNPYVKDSWSTSIKAIQDGLLSVDEGWELHREARIILPEYPEMECFVLNHLTKIQTEVFPQITDDQHQLIRGEFERTLECLSDNNRFDLSVSVFCTHADYLYQNKGVNEMVDHALVWLSFRKLRLIEQYDLFKHIHALTVKTQNTEALEKLILEEYKRRKVFTRNRKNKDFKHYCSSLAQVSRAYSSYLEKKGKYTEALELSIRLDRIQQENTDLYNLPDVIKQDRSIGAVEELIGDIANNALGVYVWRIRYKLPKGVKVHVSLQHAAVGEKGAFYLVAWSDTDNNGVPDTQVAISPLLQVEKKGQWSHWEFVSEDRSLFVGFATKSKKVVYYKMRGELKGYSGLGNRLFHTRTFGDTPEQLTKKPRYTNMRVKILRSK